MSKVWLYSKTQQVRADSKLERKKNTANFNFDFSTEKHDAFLYPFLSVMDKKTYIDLLIQEAISLSQNSQYFSPKLNLLAQNLGQRVESRYHQHILKKNKDIEKVTNKIFFIIFMTND